MRINTHTGLVVERRRLEFNAKERATLRRAYEILEQAREYVTPESMEDSELAEASMRIDEVIGGLTVSERMLPPASRIPMSTLMDNA